MPANPLNVNQGFLPGDVLRLDIQRDPVGTELQNLLPNPDGAKGAWGWTTNVSNTRMTVSSGTFVFTTTTGGQSVFVSDLFGAVPGDYISAAWENVGHSGMAYHRVRFEWFDQTKTVIGRSDMTGFMPSTAGTRYTASQVPTGVTYVRIRFDMYADTLRTNPSAGAHFDFKNPRIITSTTQRLVVVTNLFSNGGFETNLNNWTASSDGVGAGSWPVLARVTGGAIGTYCARTTHVGGTTDNLNSDGFIIPVVPGQTGTISYYTKAVTTARSTTLAVDWFDGNGGAISTSTFTPGPNTTSAWVRRSATVTPPANADSAAVHFKVNGAAVNEQHLWDGLMWEIGTSVSTYTDDTQLVSGTLPTCPSAYYTSLANEIQSISITRPELDLGTMTVAVPYDSLDPSVNPLIKPGRRVALYVAPDLANPTAWEEMFIGIIDQPKATYDFLQPAGSNSTLVTFSATDAVGRLANTGQSSGVGTIANLPGVLEGAATPWNVNGNTNQVASVPIVGTDDNASVLDQVVRTRDSVLGYAWVDRHGVVQAWDAASISTTLADTLTESVYNQNLEVDFDNEVVINSVSVVLKDAAGNETTYGPFIDSEALRLNNGVVAPATFTVYGISPGAIPGYAQQILTANARPKRRISSVVIPINTANLPRTIRDLYDLVRVVNTRAGIDTNMRITSVEHTIGIDSWLMTLSFTSDGRVAVPTVGTAVQSAATWTDSPTAFRVGNTLIQTGGNTGTVVTTDASGNATVPFPITFAAAPAPQVNMGTTLRASIPTAATTTGIPISVTNAAGAAIAATAVRVYWTAIGAAS